MGKKTKISRGHLLLENGEYFNKNIHLVKVRKTMIEMELEK
jgi:hypothetical protein